MRISVRYIATDHEHSRIRFMNDWLETAGIDFSRSRGVFVNSIDEVDLYDSVKRLSRFGYDLTLSELGCFLAHRNCWFECMETGDPMLILESDVHLRPGLVLGDMLQRLLGQIESFDIARLHGIFEHNEFLRRYIGPLGEDFEMYQCIGDPMGGGAYLVTPYAAEVLFTSSRANPSEGPEAKSHPRTEEVGSCSCPS